MNGFTIAHFEAGQLPDGGFTHEAHVFVGWLYVQAFGAEEAVGRFDAALRRLVGTIGATSKYNAMITWLFMKLIAERSLPGERWAQFRARNLDLIDDRPRSAG